RIPRPTCRDDGDTPLWWARDGAAYNSDFQKCKAKYFCAGDWTIQISLRLLGKLDFRRAGFVRFRAADAANRPAILAGRRRNNEIRSASLPPANRCCADPR